MTISGWHDDYRYKDAGHDEMQAVVWRHYCKQIGKQKIQRTIYDTKDFCLQNVFVEFPITHRRSEHDTGQIVGFADVGLGFLEEFTEEKAARAKEGRPYVKQDRWFILLEVKPKIYSVGSVIRQCRALESAATRAGLRCDVRPMVYRDDPSAELLSELWPDTGTWDRPSSP